MPPIRAPLTISQVNKAGRVLRVWWETPPGEEDADLERKFEWAVGVVDRYRATHRKALTSANMGLRSVVKTEGCEIEVSQRLKRMITIIDKLARYPRMALSTMQDIGGCRAVLRDIDEVRRVQRRLSKNRPPSKMDDYVTDPRSSGYRGVHLIVQYDDPPRNIEVQLRTRVMHEWAFTVERLGGRMGADLKSGIGPPEVLRLLEAISEAMALEELGKTVDSTLQDRIHRLRQDALPYLVVRPSGRPT